MSLEQDLYELGWRFCARCGVRRPSRAIGPNGECIEAWWCTSALPACKGCGEPVPQLPRGRRRDRHPLCGGNPVVVSRSPENAATARIGNDSGIGEGRQP